MEFLRDDKNLEIFISNENLEVLINIKSYFSYLLNSYKSLILKRKFLNRKSNSGLK